MAKSGQDTVGVKLAQEVAHEAEEVAGCAQPYDVHSLSTAARHSPPIHRRFYCALLIFASL